MAKNKHLKRKPTAFIKSKQKETSSTAIKESALEEEVGLFFVVVIIFIASLFSFF